MDEKQAKALAKAIGGEDWQSGGGIYVVGIRRPDGKMVVISDDLVAEYEDDEAFDEGRATSTILLRDDPTEYWVVQDEDGDVALEYPDHGRGWASEEEAAHEARYLETQLGKKHWARRQELRDTASVQS